MYRALSIVKEPILAEILSRDSTFILSAVTALANIFSDVIAFVCISDEVIAPATIWSAVIVFFVITSPSIVSTVSDTNFPELFIA